MYNDMFKKFSQLILRLAYLEQSSWTDDAQQNYWWAGFPFFIKRNNGVIIFPQAQWKVRVIETDSVFVT